MTFIESTSEQQKNLCQVCKGFRQLCGKGLCPILVQAKSFASIKKVFSKKDFFGASPPGVFVGEFGYPKVSLGPLVPPLTDKDTAIFDAEDQWIFKTIDEIIGYRTSLLRGKRQFNVRSARAPKEVLEITQELVMASEPVDTELSFIKRPRLDIIFSSRAAPSGPSGEIKQAILAENPKVPRQVDKVVSDTDLKAIPGTIKLYDAGIPQRQITRLFSVGLFGIEKQRRLVPTTWSITAVDDILSKKLWKEVLTKNWINTVQLFGYKALGNNVQLLLYPSGWLFEVLEYWLLTMKGKPDSDWENWKGRKTYAKTIAGAYYATRLPVLEYLARINRQAGALVFLEVDKSWIPLGVWRFREIAREAFQQEPKEFETVEEALEELKKRLVLPLDKWLEASTTIDIIQNQTTLEDFFPKELHG
ncbi:MAG: hypothetical protein GF308_05990 [Candidatus Heimdallarchaeota archaeon]|nr:hypothetical protein [Candidatus Heimdallarchaeota archaeon]